MKLNRQQQILNEIALIHEEWEAEFEGQVEMDQDHSDPHDQVTSESDYNQHHVARSASPEQEKVFQDRIAVLFAELEAITANAPGAPVTASSGELAAEEDVSTSVDFDLAVNGDLVLMLVKQDFDTGTVSYREKGEWVDVLPKQEIPALDDSELISVTGGATPIWDKAEGAELRLMHFREVLLDLHE